MKTLFSLAASIREDYARRRILLETRGLSGLIINSKGYVLIIALLMTSLLISITGNFIVETQTSIAYMKKFDARLRGACVARSGVELMKMILEADKKGITGSALGGKGVSSATDSYLDIWAMEFPPIPFEGAALRMEIGDENSKININAFANEFTEKTRYYYMAQTLFVNMGLPMDYADALHDWVDPDDQRLPYGAETGDYYLTLTPPYSARNRAMDSIDEMLMIKDMTPEIFYGLGGGNSGLEDNLVRHNMGDVILSEDRIREMMKGGRREAAEKSGNATDDFKIGKEKSRALRDYLRVYGDSRDFLNDYNRININTASYRVISALTENMTDDKVSEIIRRRLVKPYESVDEIKDIIGNDEQFETLKKYISVKSYIFRIKTVATVNSTEVTITAYYNRDKKSFLYWCEE